MRTKPLLRAHMCVCVCALHQPRSSVYSLVLLKAEIELQYARSLDGLYSKFIKPRSERGAVANVAKALRSAFGLKYFCACHFILLAFPTSRVYTC